jgi:hypothetical protein
MIAGLSWWYRNVGQEGFPPRHDLDEGKRILYDALESLGAVAAGRAFDDPLRAQVREAFAEDGIRDFLGTGGLDGEAYVRERGGELTDLSTAVRGSVEASLAGFAPSLLASLAGLTRDWDAGRRRDLLVRYLGFPLWDVLLYPTQVLSMVGEQDAIEIVRMSPHEATVLDTPAAQKVLGAQLHHFYAFFHRSARENDYLWGRLDGAEHLIRLLLDAAGSSSGQSLEAWCKRAFTAILDEEKDSLTTIRGTVDDLRAKVGAL